MTVDTWRWDYLGVSGSGKVVTPNLDTLAKQGIYEAEVLSPCPLTTPAHATMLTGLLPLQHGVLDCSNYHLDATPETLAESFLKKGYRTGAFVSAEPLHRRFGLSRGFEKYDDSGWTAAPGAAWLPAVRDGAATTDAALRWVQQEGMGRPLFLWVHYFDAHRPYRSRKEHSRKYPDDIYAQQVAFVDAEVGRLTGKIKEIRPGAWRIAIVGDHGEGLGDHGEREHGLALYRATVHVPLILWPRPAAAVVLRQPWALQDLAPTLRRWFALPGAATDGDSLFSARTAARDLPLLSALPALIYGVEPSVGLRRGDWLYLRQGREELFDLQKDPDQREDIARNPHAKSTLIEMRGRLGQNIQGRRLREALYPTLKSSPEELKKLESLGYISGGAPVGEALRRVDIQTLLDDQTRIEVERERATISGRLAGLVAAYEDMLQRYPNSNFILRNLAVERLRSGDCVGALPLLERTVRLRPQDASGLVSLGGAYLSCNETSKARIALEECLKLAPTMPEVHKNLGILFGEYLKNPKRAAQHYRSYLELAPGASDAAAVRVYISKVEKGE